MSHDVDKCYYMTFKKKMQAFFEKIQGSNITLEIEIEFLTINLVREQP